MLFLNKNTNLFIKNTENSLKNIGLILFDIDGVIRSVENSYRLSLKKTVYKFTGWEPSYIDIDNAKNEGIWNND